MDAPCVVAIVATWGQAGGYTSVGLLSSRLPAAADIARRCREDQPGVLLFFSTGVAGRAVAKSSPKEWEGSLRSDTYLTELAHLPLPSFQAPWAAAWCARSSARASRHRALQPVIAATTP